MSGYPQVIRAVNLQVDSLVSALLPGFCTIVFAVALLNVVVLSQGAQGLLRDSDTGWHVLNGETILANGTLPRVDNFSYTRAGQPWFAWEWMSDVLLGGAHRIAGLSGVALLAGFTIALTAWGAARLSVSLGGNLFFTAAAMVVLIQTTSIHWLARPHVFSWLLALVFVACAEHKRFLYALPVVACLWANMHGSFLLGPAILFLYAIGFAVAAVYEGVNKLEPSRKYSPPILGGDYGLNSTCALQFVPLRLRAVALALRRPPLQFFAAGVASLLATLINPYGWRLHEHVFTYLQNDYIMDHIAEFRSFSFHSAGAWSVELLLLIALLGTVALFKQRRLGPGVLSLGLIHISLYSARHLPTTAVVLLPLCVAALTREARSWPRLRPMLEYSDRLRIIDQKIWGVVPIVLVLALTVIARDRDLNFDAEKFPVRAARFIPDGGRVFTKDQWGGYLLYRFDGQRKVFMDGRSDFYGDGFLRTYAEVADVRPGWQNVLKQYDVNVVLIPVDHALVSVLQLSPEWKRVYADSMATIFERVG
jgi:hypothetical protein